MGGLLNMDDIDYEELCALAGADGHDACIVMTYVPQQVAVYVPNKNSGYFNANCADRPWFASSYWCASRSRLNHLSILPPFI